MTDQSGLRSPALLLRSPLAFRRHSRHECVSTPRTWGGATSVHKWQSTTCTSDNQPHAQV